MFRSMARVTLERIVVTTVVDIFVDILFHDPEHVVFPFFFFLSQLRRQQGVLLPHLQFVSGLQKGTEAIFPQFFHRVRTNFSFHRFGVIHHALVRVECRSTGGVVAVRDHEAIVVIVIIFISPSHLVSFLEQLLRFLFFLLLFPIPHSLLWGRRGVFLFGRRQACRTGSCACTFVCVCTGSARRGAFDVIVPAAAAGGGPLVAAPTSGCRRSPPVRRRGDRFFRHRGARLACGAGGSTGGTGGRRRGGALFAARRRRGTSRSRSTTDRGRAAAPPVPVPIFPTEDHRPAGPRRSAARRCARHGARTRCGGDAPRFLASVLADGRAAALAEGFDGISADRSGVAGASRGSRGGTRAHPAPRPGGSRSGATVGGVGGRGTGRFTYTGDPGVGTLHVCISTCVRALGCRMASVASSVQGLQVLKLNF
mmetsp:Transcript_17115/g.34067  ORF Transcript_17115/g.34067 Transcript_17115/m.34067 type:complete len:424 (+) Transcript_17115:590-1861(+)